MDKFRDEVIDLLIELGNFPASEAAYIAAVNMPTIKGCFDREMTPNEAYNLIMTGSEN